jgi:glycogen debranching enzyme
LAYHNGSVWPHDNALIAAGLARYGRWDEAWRIVHAIVTASGYFSYQLPEVFAGLSRSETPFPIAYPTAARPQAWAAGTPVLMLQLLLGLTPDRRTHALVSAAPREVPAWAGAIRLTGVRVFGRPWDIRLQSGHVRVRAA